MSYKNAAAINDILTKEKKLHQDLKNRSLTVEDYLKRDEEIDQLYRNIGQEFESLHGLEGKLLEVMDSVKANEFIDHEREHADRAIKYGMQSKFIYVEIKYFHVGTVDDPEDTNQKYIVLRRSNSTEIITITQYFNFREIAENWNLGQIEKFLADTARVSNPSENDKRYEPVWN